MAQPRLKLNVSLSFKWFILLVKKKSRTIFLSQKGLEWHLTKEFHLKKALMLSFCRTFQLYQSAFTRSVTFLYLHWKSIFLQAQRLSEAHQILFSFSKSNLIWRQDCTAFDLEHSCKTSVILKNPLNPRSGFNNGSICPSSSHRALLFCSQIWQNS